VKIVMISDHESQGGAAQSASRLAEALCDSHEVVRIVLLADGLPHPWRTVTLGTESAVARWLKRLPRKLWNDRFPWPNTPAFVGRQLRGLLRRLRPDVVNLHNLHGGADWGWGVHIANVAAEFAPVVWTLHDMWTFTGRCAYAYDCAMFQRGCDATCPTADEAPRLAPERIAKAWLERRRLFTDHPDLVAVTPSRWLAAQARTGLWGGHRIDVIPYGVPTDVFAPIPREEARRRLGVPAAGPVLLLAAHDLTERRKGAAILPHLWQHIRRPLTVLTMGHGRLEVGDSRIRVLSLGWVGEDRTKALAYNAADALLHPAPVDNFPNVLLEAFACGTPAIGFPIGGVTEQIRPGVSGWLADGLSAAALGEAVNRGLGEIAGGVNLRGPCRRLAEREFGMDRQGQGYTKLFREISAAQTTAGAGSRQKPVLPAGPSPAARSCVDSAGAV
jgi:glycosyltransferase involved in cell wall biosynthesis